MSILILAFAAAAHTPHVVFRCETERGVATIASLGGVASYRFRPTKGRAPDVGPAAAHGVRRRWSDVHDAMETQIRFTRDRWSYTVHSIDAKRAGGISPASGVQIRNGPTVVADLTCRGRTRLLPDETLNALPEDDDPWNAM